MITFTFKTEALNKAMQGKFKSLLVGTKNGMVDGMRDFETQILRTQMSGPTSNNSLSVRTGFLRRSWFIEKTDMGDYDFVVRLATRAPYARVHQYGGAVKHPGTPNGFGKGIKIPAHIINIPKRLHILEEFKTLGRKMIGWSIQRRWKEVLAR